MSNFGDSFGDSFDDPWSQRLPGDPKPQERSYVEIEDRAGFRQTVISQGPVQHPGTNWNGPEGGTVIDSRPYG